MIKFSKTEDRILRVLSDGRPHKKEDLAVAIDELADPDSVKVYVSRLNDKLEQMGQEILCRVMYKSHFYQHIRLLPSANDGHT